MSFTLRSTAWIGTLCALLASASDVAAASRQRCEAFIDADVANIEGTTPVQVKSASYVPATGELPAYCHLETYLNPHIGMDVFLPEDWNGKFLKRGCGGSCGRMYFNAWMPMCKTTLSRGYACSLDDMGHQSTSYDFKWAYNNLQGKLDFALRSTHLTTIAAKAIIERFYGRPVQRSYFLGASSGGRQGLSLVQQFPLHFDGVMVGAPDGLDPHLHPLWSVLANLDENGRSILEPADIPILHRAVLLKCDAIDGLSDGLLTDPRECDFDVSSLLCSGSKTAECLTPAQIDAARKIYQGPVDSQGRSLGFGPAFGSEPNWVRTFISLENGKPSVYNKYFGDSFRYLRFPTDPGPTWQPQDFDWDRDPRRLYLMRAMSGVHNPDLRAFRDRGGKLIMWHGLADQSVLPWGSMDYYEIVQQTMGGRKATQEFVRLFVLPGVNHVYRGAGAGSVDWLAYMEDWVERDRAPDVVIGARLKERPEKSDMIRARAYRADEIEFERPHFPYPLQARYDGKGDPTKHASFVAYEPTARKPVRVVPPRRVFPSSTASSPSPSPTYAPRNSPSVPSDSIETGQFP